MTRLMTLVVGLCAAAAFAGGFELKGDAAKGAETYKMMCASCHGDKGDGAGPAGAALNPKPANFTDAKRAAEIDDQYTYEIIKEGGAAKGKSPLMVSWKAAMDDQKLRDVTAYVRSLGAKKK